MTVEQLFHELGALLYDHPEVAKVEVYAEAGGDGAVHQQLVDHVRIEQAWDDKVFVSGEAAQR